MQRLARGAVPALGRPLMSAIFISAGTGEATASAGTIAAVAAHGLPFPHLEITSQSHVELNESRGKNVVSAKRRIRSESGLGES